MRFIVDCAKFSEQRFYSAPPTTVSVFSSLKLGPTESQQWRIFEVVLVLKMLILNRYIPAKTFQQK